MISALDKLETDATGTYYKAFNKKTGDIVSLKIMSEEVMASASFRGRFIEETKRSASLSHPGIRRLITVGCKDNRYFYTSEYIEGSSLKQILDEKKKLSPTRIIFWEERKKNLEKDGVPWVSFLLRLTEKLMTL